MNRAEHFAIKKALEIIKMRIDEAYRYVRSDERGTFARERRDSFYSEVEQLMAFIDNAVTTGLEPSEKEEK